MELGISGLVMGVGGTQEQLEAELCGVGTRCA